MAPNLAEHVNRTLTGQTIISLIGWLNGFVAIQWVKRENKYKHFMSNRVAQTEQRMTERKQKTKHRPQK